MHHRARLGSLLILLTLFVTCLLLWPRSAHQSTSESDSGDLFAVTSSTTQQQTTAPFDPMPLVNRHLEAADTRVQRLVSGKFDSIDAVFFRAHDNVLPFVQVCLGWNSKWRIAADAVPFTQGDRHQVFIKEQFEKYLFSTEQLESAIRDTVDQFIREVQSIEGKMLVELRADLPDLPEFEPIHAMTKDELQVRFDQAIQDAIHSVGTDFQADIGSQLVSLIAGEVIAQVAVRLGVSAGILGVGAASGWATFGIGVIVGVIVDHLVSKFMDWWHDPDIELAVELAKKLSQLRQLICEGDEEVNGLRRELDRVAQARREVRRQAVLQLFHDTRPHHEGN